MNWTALILRQVPGVSNVCFLRNDSTSNSRLTTRHVPGTKPDGARTGLESQLFQGFLAFQRPQALGIVETKRAGLVCFRDTCSKPPRSSLKIPIVVLSLLFILLFHDLQSLRKLASAGSCPRRKCFLPASELFSQHCYAKSKEGCMGTWFNIRWTAVGKQ